MVRSGTFLTRHISLKHGAKLVWDPEIVDIAIQTQGASWVKPGNPGWLCRAKLDLAVQVVRWVVDDVFSVELHCGRSKPFSTHSGMGLPTERPQTSITFAITTLMPRTPCISVSADLKMRQLPTQQDTLALMERIANKGSLTIRYRTRNVPPRDRALVRRLKEVVDFVEGLGRDVTVVGNDDCIPSLSPLPPSRPDRFLASTARWPRGHFHLALLRLARAVPLPSHRAVVRRLNCCQGTAGIVQIWSTTGRRPRSVFTSSKSRKSANKALRNGTIKARGYADLDALMQDWINDKCADTEAAIDTRNLTARPSPGYYSLSSQPPPEFCEETEHTSG
ncbi:hypothetical protein EDB92DRAFT_1813733 [Lactarius akahatsu]|uniref:Uncharacterized protein n=1 Tax=Lactarius akahatsu TaxID=416441 RepID=A0AAD4LNL8_9AGAM|nr:hypothetical protein EDB92DRAFT_1813733 [Lactarius akahatsu]